MKLKIINSNSKGNCYILESENEALLIECGVKYSEIKEAIDFNTNKIDMCVLTHEHRDHSKSHLQILASGIPIASSKGTFKALNVEASNRAFILAHGNSLKYKNWTVKSFRANHDAKEPLSFIISHPQSGEILFVTDSYKLNFDLKTKFKHVIIEANYCEDIAEKYRQSKGNAFVEKRRLKSHMSYQTARLTLQKLDLSECNNIVLIHLSDGLTDEGRFKFDCENKTGIKTTIAGQNQIINFSKEPF